MDLEDKNKQQKVYDIPVYVAETKSIKVNNQKLVLYNLRGTLLEQEISRPYSEFDLFRKKLKEMYPCIFIPGIPNRDFLGDMEVYLSEMKSKLLNHFLKKLIENKELLNSNVTKTFLSKEKDYKVTLENYKRESFTTIYSKYRTYFTDFEEEKFESKSTERELDIFRKNMEAYKEKFDIIGKLLEDEIINVFQEQNAFNSVFELFTKLEKEIPGSGNTNQNVEKIIKPIKSCNLPRPYFIFYHYYLKTIADIDAFIEAFWDLDKFRKKYEEYMTQLKKLSLAGGTKFSFTKYLHEKNKIQTEQGDKAYPIETEAYYLRFVIDISMFVLQKQCSVFKETLFSKYREEIGKLKKSLLMKNLRSVELWEEMANALK